VVGQDRGDGTKCPAIRKGERHHWAQEIELALAGSRWINEFARGQVGDRENSAGFSIDLL
jgi:hypothetical protein